MERSVHKDAVIVLMAVVIALALRLPWLSYGASSDELGNLMPGGFLQLFLHPESGVNPPTLRWISSAAGGGLTALYLLRGLSVLGGLVSVGASVLIARALGASTSVAFATGALLAAHPEHLAASTTARAYGPWLGMAALHVLALLRHREDPTRWRPVVLTAALLPWLHYLAVPFLLALGLGDRARIRLYLPAALAALPLGWLVLTRTAFREAPEESVLDPLLRVLTWGLSGTSPGGVWTSTTGLWLAGITISGLSLLALRRAWRTADELPARLLLAIAASSLLFAPFKAVRSPVSALAATTMAPPALALSPAPVALLGALTVFVMEQAEFSTPRLQVELRNAARDVGMHPTQEGVLHIMPSHMALPVVLHATGAWLPELPRTAACEGHTMCGTWRDRSFVGVEHVARPGVTVSLTRVKPQAAGCEVEGSVSRGWWVRCL